MKQFFCFWWKAIAITFRMSAKGDEVTTFIEKVTNVLTGGLAWLLVLTPALGLWQKEWFPFLPWISAIGLFFLLFLYAPYRLWSDEHDRAQKAERELQPRLKCFFDMSNPGCVRPNTKLTTTVVITDGRQRTMRQLGKVGIYYRLAVEVAGNEVVSRCTGYLTKIQRNSKPWVDGENLLLTFAPAEQPDSAEKDLRPGVTAYLDLLFISDENEVFLTTKDFRGPSSVNFEQMFANTGIYIFHVVISTANHGSITHDISFRWTGERSSSSLRSVDG